MSTIGLEECLDGHGHGQQIAVEVTIDVGDRFTELGQISNSHAVLTLVHFDAQPEPDLVGDIEPV